jgi:hypothetical protein
MFHANAMEIELKSSDSETVEQFIERTRKQPELTPECTKFFDNHNLQCVRYSFSPDETKLAAVTVEKSVSENAVGPQFYLMIMNLHGIKPEITLKKTLSFANEIEDYERIALSPKGSTIATFHENRECYEDIDFCEFIFKIKKVNAIQSGKIDEKKINFPYNFYPTIIAFNKQETLLIAHGEDPVTYAHVHCLFPVKCWEQYK